MDEIWKDIKGFEGLYQVSNLGRVKGLNRVSLDKRHLPDRILTGSVYSTGYVVVKLRVNGIAKRFSMHRLVAEHFIPNPKNLPIINHKDENKLNNRWDNLEWCTQQYNATYGNAKTKALSTFKKNHSRTVYQFTLSGEFICQYDSISSAAESTNTCRSEVCSCCNMEKNVISANGFMWRYADDCPNKRITPYSIKQSSLTQKVAQYSLDGEFINDFNSISEAVRKTGTRHSSIYACCVGKYRTANGYLWKYKND